MARLVVAFGGNALGNTPAEQIERIEKAVIPIAELVEQGHQIILTHGNGPQVGLIANAFSAAKRCGELACDMPFPECGAMSQGYIGYHIQSALRHELNKRNISVGVVSLVTQMTVDRNDPAFGSPTKFVGAFMSEDEAKQLSSERGITVREDSGRGWRQVVPSPIPTGVLEQDAIKTLFDAGYVVIAAGGGGIPVAFDNGRYKGTPAVIDKDFAAARLADLVDADKLVILTAVDKVYIDFNKPTAKALDCITADEARKYIDEGQFAAGSMLPKVLAALSFVESTGGEAIIAALKDAPLALSGKSGTRIVTAY